MSLDVVNADPAEAMTLWRRFSALAAIFLSLSLVNCGGGPDVERHLGYLRADPFPRLVIEIDYVGDSRPHPNLEAELEEELHEILDKPGGIDIVLDEQIGSRGENHRWGTGELIDLSEDSKDLEIADDTTRIHVLYLDGHSASDGDGGLVLGLAWANSSIAIFKKSVLRGCRLGGMPSPELQEMLCEKAEKSILVHELGHVFGLVENPLPMLEDHRDREHGRHCTNKECVMYWQHRIGRIFAILKGRIMNGNENALGFGEFCVEDMAAARDG